MTFRAVSGICRVPAVFVVLVISWLLLLAPGGCLGYTTSSSSVANGFSALIKNIQIQFNDLRSATKVGLLDHTYGYILGSMLQSSFLLNRLGEAMSKSTLSLVDYSNMHTYVDQFDSTFKKNHSVFSPNVSGYSRMKELQQAIQDMEDPFKYKLPYILRSLGKGSKDVSDFTQFWDNLPPERIGILRLFRLANQSSNDDFISVWRRDASRCDPILFRPFFLEIQINVFRDFVSREIYLGITGVQVVSPDLYLRQIVDLNIRMMEVLNYCWERQVKLKAERAYLKYQRSRFNSGNKPMWTSRLLLTSFVVLQTYHLYERTSLW